MLRRLRNWLRHEPPDEGASMVLPDHESAVRSMMAEAHGGSYKALRSLTEAKGHQEGAVVLEGDDGGQIYVTSPARLVNCEESTLDRLLLDLDRIAWPGLNGTGARVYYEVIAVGGGVAGGMGGAPLVDDIWVHDEFVETGHDEAIRAVIRGEAQRLARE